MAQSLSRLKESPSQTAGPYVHIGLTPNFGGIGGVYPVDLGATMLNDKTKGERIHRDGRLHVERGDQRLYRRSIGNGADDRAGPDQRVAFEIHLGDQPLRERAAEDREMDV